VRVTHVGKSAEQYEKRGIEQFELSIGIDLFGCICKLRFGYRAFGN